MATSEGDVIMANDSSTTDKDAPPSTSQLQSQSGSQAQSRRTDHDRQYYFLPAEPLPRSVPHASQNVISSYGLDEIHSRVRRQHPVTGEKINKLRKSYVGIAKNQRLAGKVVEVNTPGQWIDGSAENPGLLDYDQEGWSKTPVGEKLVSESTAAAMLAKLDRAMQIAPGRMDNSETWKRLLGDEYGKTKAPAVVGLKGTAVPGKASAVPSPKLGAQQRSQRAGAKRSYDDSSFAGYEDTYDDLTLPGGSEMGGPNGMRKKARKDIPIAQALGQGAYNNVGLMAGGVRQR